MNVRALERADLDDALQLWQRTEHLGRVPREEVEGVLDHDPGLVLAAEWEGRLVGVVLGTFDGRRGWIQRLAVVPELRRTGVARALVDELERRLRARGCVQVNLLVFDDNEAGRAFWEHLGYEGTERLVMYRRRIDDPDGDRAADPVSGGPEDRGARCPGSASRPPDAC